MKSLPHYIFGNMAPKECAGIRVISVPAFRPSAMWNANIQLDAIANPREWHDQRFIQWWEKL